MPSGDETTEPGPLDVAQFQRWIDELVSLLSRSPSGTRHDASAVATTLLEFLTATLRLDVAYVRATPTPDGAAPEWGRLATRVCEGADLRAVGVAFEPYLAGPLRASAATVPGLLDGGHMPLAVVPLGFASPLATLVVGAAREGFPAQPEHLLLQVAASQAAVAFMEALGVGHLQRDTTERVRHGERELRLLVDSVPHLIGAVSPDGRMLLMNEAATTYLGTSLEEGVGAQEWRDRFYHPDDRGAMQRSIQRAIADGVPQGGEARIRRHDGQYRWFAVRHEALRDEHGALIRLYASATDIHDRKADDERIRGENRALREQIDSISMFEEIVGVSAPLQAVLSHVSRVASTESTVLITGETGTGKELVARAIHKRSQRSSRAFITVNCAALPTSLIASELFGHEKGAFTGAVQMRQGRFELADGGTVFLDEVGELPLDAQVMLLRVLQEREFERVGGNRPIRTNVRVIAATNQHLTDAVAQKTFRADLYYRLNVFPIEMPPLRDRRPDIALLVEYFGHRFARRMGKRLQRIDTQTLQRLERYHWPGNVRELQNIVERAMIVSDSDTLFISDRWLSTQAPPRASTPTLVPETLVQHERQAIESALEASRGRVAGPFGAARSLGVPPTTLESKIKALGIDKRRFKSSDL